MAPKITQEGSRNLEAKVAQRYLRAQDDKLLDRLMKALLQAQTLRDAEESLAAFRSDNDSRAAQWHCFDIGGDFDDLTRDIVALAADLLSTMNYMLPVCGDDDTIEAACEVQQVGALLLRGELHWAQRGLLESIQLQHRLAGHYAKIDPEKFQLLYDYQSRLADIVLRVTLRSHEQKRLKREE